MHICILKICLEIIWHRRFGQLISQFHLFSSFITIMRTSSMHVHITGRCKPFVTFVTLEWFLPSMSVVMFFKTLSCSKSFGTNIARKWLMFVLSVKNIHMNFQAHFSNYFATYMATCLFVYSPYVFL